MKYSELCLAHISTHWVLYTQLFSSLWQHSRDRWLSPSCHIHNLSWYLSQQSFLGSVKLFFFANHLSLFLFWLHLVIKNNFNILLSFFFISMQLKFQLLWCGFCWLPRLSLNMSSPKRWGLSLFKKKKKRRSDVSTSYVSKARERR